MSRMARRRSREQQRWGIPVSGSLTQDDQSGNDQASRPTDASVGSTDEQVRKASHPGPTADSATGLSNH